MTQLDTVAFDIETSGFSTEDQLTVVGLDRSFGSRVFLNCGGREAPVMLADQLNEDIQPKVSLSMHDNERAVLQAVGEFVGNSIVDRQIKLVAYNGEHWRGGFDLPFLRTRLIHHGVEWPFTDLPYIEVMDIFETQFNTTENTLVGVYDELVGGELGNLDPFNDSAEAVDVWERGEFEPLVRHNIADIRRTRVLMNLAERYCSKSDFSMKSLTPVIAIIRTHQALAVWVVVVFLVCGDDLWWTDLQQLFHLPIPIS